MDFCSGGKCYESLSFLLSSLDGEKKATSSCDILSSIYESGEITGLHSNVIKGNRQLVLLRGGMILDLINKGIIVESTYAWNL